MRTKSGAHDGDRQHRIDEPRPKIATIAIASSREGNVSMISISRIIAISITPRRSPPPAPVRSATIESATTAADRSDRRAPWIRRENTSRPIASVPAGGQIRRCHAGGFRSTSSCATLVGGAAPARRKPRRRRSATPPARTEDHPVAAAAVKYPRNSRSARAAWSRRRCRRQASGEHQRRMPDARIDDAEERSTVRLTGMMTMPISRMPPAPPDSHGGQSPGSASCRRPATRRSSR